MLSRLGRWLRAAGYDTAIAEGGLPDGALIARCAAKARTLLTRDRHLAAAAQGRVTVVRLAETGLTAQARALKAALGIDWQTRAVHPLPGRQYAARSGSARDG